jgi:predicted permease
VPIRWPEIDFEHECLYLLRMHCFIQDLRYGFRQMRRSPGFVVVAVLTLALGIGANTAVFSIVNAILLRPLPYKDSDRLVRIVENIPASESFSGAPQRVIGMSPDDFQEWRVRTKTLSAMAMEMPVSMTMAGREAVRLSGQRVSPALFPMLNIQPALGRVFQPAEEKPGSENVLILSYGAWQQFFGRDPQLLGRTLTLDNTAYTVIGVMPRQFVSPEPFTEFWIPLPMSPPKPGQFIKLRVTARLKDDVTPAAAAAEANAIGLELRGNPPADPSTGLPRIQLMTWKEDLVATIRLPLLVFVIAVTLVLLVACINVANLFLARGTARSREIAIRMALGAGRARVIRHLLTEHAVLSGFGGAIGVVLAFAGTRLFTRLGQSLARTDLMRFEAAGNAIPRLSEVSIDATVLLFTVVLTLATGLLSGLIPAFQIGGVRYVHQPDLRLASSTKRTFQSWRAGMVVSQIALTLMLMLGAGLLLKSFIGLVTTKLGYEPENVLTFKIPQPALAYEEKEKQRQQNAFAYEVVTRLASVPDIQAAAFTNGLPMVQGFFVLLVKGGARSADVPQGRVAAISPDYFRAMRMRLIAGRGFNESDRGNSRAVYVINKAAAKAYFPDVNPIGKTISGAGFDIGEIVGIVDDTRQAGLDREPEPQLFLDIEHMDAVYGGGYYFVVRTAKDPAALVPVIRDIVRDIDSTRVVDGVATMNAILSNSLTTPRSYAILLGTFSAIAMALAMIGLYGVLAFFVTQRTHEIGIRRAVGAQQSDVLLLVLKQGLAFSIAGAMLGVAGSMFLTRYLEKMLFGVTPLDPFIFVVAPAIFVSVTLIASLIPARRAAKIDPLAALRYE